MAEIIVNTTTTSLSIVEGETNETTIVTPASVAIELSASGPQGPIGVGVPSGGTAGDLLVRTASGTGWTVDPVVDSLTVDIAASGAIAPGQFRWNNREHTLDVGQLRGVVNQLGQEITMTCLNTSANTIGNGKAVMFTGTDDATGHPTIGLMIADGSIPGKNFFGVATEEIAPSGEGYVTIFGKVRDIDTSMFPEDSILWLNPNNPGEFTLIQPDAPALKIAAAAVIHSDPVDGALLVRADPGQTISECHDVYTEQPINGDVLTWRDGFQRWESRPPANASAPRSITITYPQNGDSFTLFRASRELTVSSIDALVSSNSVTYEIRAAADRTTAGTLIATSTVTSTTTGTSAAIQNQPIPEGRWVWVNITGVSGEPVSFSLSIAF